MPSGSTSGSKLIMRTGLVSSLSMRSIVSVPVSIFSRFGGQAIVASSGLTDRQDQAPLQRVGMHLRDEGVEEKVRVAARLIGRGGSERLERDHRPAHRRRPAGGVDQGEGVQAVVRAVVEA